MTISHSVIYGNQVATPVSNQSSSQENMKFFKRRITPSEMEQKEDYMGLVLHQRSPMSEENDNNNNKIKRNQRIL